MLYSIIVLLWFIYMEYNMWPFIETYYRNSLMCSSSISNFIIIIFVHMIIF